jgi:hypothetical protein
LNPQHRTDDGTKGAEEKRRDKEWRTTPKMAVVITLPTHIISHEVSILQNRQLLPSSMQDMDYPLQRHVVEVMLDDARRSILRTMDERRAQFESGGGEPDGGSAPQHHPSAQAQS